jgi:hypothetical protein
MQLEIEREALRKERDKASKERLASWRRSWPISRKSAAGWPRTGSRRKSSFSSRAS